MKAFFVTVSIAGIFFTLLLFAMLASRSNSALQLSLSDVQDADKLIWAQDDISDSLASLYGISIASIGGNATAENVTIMQIKPQPQVSLDSFLSFVNSTLPGYLGLGVSIANASPPGQILLLERTGLKYYYSYSNYSGISSASGSTNITNYALNISSDTVTNATLNWTYDPAGTVNVTVLYADPNGTKSFNGRLRSNASNILRFYDTSRSNSTYFNISIGLNAGVASSLNLSYAGMQATWNLTYSRPTINRRLSEWVYSDVIWLSSGRYTKKNNVDVRIGSPSG